MQPKKKKQHFVPRFYLKYFSYNNEDKQIGIFNRNTDFFIQKGELRSQAKENYFYDKTGKVEDALSIIEGESSIVINEIIKTESLPKENSEEHITLLVFILILMLRTKSHENLTNESIDKFYKQVYKDDIRVKDTLEDISIGIENAATFAISTLPKILPLALDLKSKLIINSTRTPFITSDNPVMKYNQYLERKKHPGGITGIECKGLQIFFPITPKLTVIFYDSWVYKVGNRKDKKIIIEEKEEIDQLNLCQFLNCQQNLYFNEIINKEYLDSIQKKSEKYENSGIVSVNEYPDFRKTEGENTSSLVVTGATDVKIRLKINRIKETSNGKSFRMSNKAFYSRKAKNNS